MCLSKSIYDINIEFLFHQIKKTPPLNGSFFRGTTSAIATELLQEENITKYLDIINTMFFKYKNINHPEENLFKHQAAFCLFHYHCPSVHLPPLILQRSSSGAGANYCTLTSDKRQGHPGRSPISEWAKEETNDFHSFAVSSIVNCLINLIHNLHEAQLQAKAHSLTGKFKVK